jgi:hypothetical protein
VRSRRSSNFNSYWDIPVTGAPMDFRKLTMKTMVRYMKTHEGIRRVSEGLKAAGKPSP